MLALLLILLPATVGAVGQNWTYNSDAQTLTCTTDSGETITLNKVTADGKNLTIGNNEGFAGTTLDLSGTVTDQSGGTTYTITAIGNQAFYYCTGLSSIELPDSLVSIGDYSYDISMLK